MPSALQFIGGGLLQGIGRGLVLDGKEKRERALADLEHQRRLERDEQQLEGRRGLLDASNTAAAERLELNIGSREKVAGQAASSRERLASEATTSREAIASEAAASREKIGTAANVSRERAATIRAGKATDTTAAEDRIIKRHVDVDENGNETVNHEAAAVELDERGFKRAAAAQRRKAKGIFDQDIRKRAEEFADQMVEEQDTFLSSDDVDFKDDGGSRTRFRARMVREFIAKNGGKPAEAPAGSPAGASVSPYVGNTPPPGFPNARRASDGFWYIKSGPGPKDWQRVVTSSAAPTSN
jgi:hypothetical protein